MATVLDLASTMVAAFSSANMISLLTNLSTVLVACPSLKVSVCNLVAKSSCHQPNAAFQAEMFNKYCVLWHNLLSETDWLLFTEATKQFRDFLKFAFKDGEYKQRVKQMIPPEKLREVSDFIAQADTKFDDQQTSALLLEIQEDLIQRSKRRKMDSQALDSKMLTGLKLINDGLALLKNISLSPESSSSLRKELKSILPQLITLENSLK